MRNAHRSKQIQSKQSMLRAEAGHFGDYYTGQKLPFLEVPIRGVPILVSTVAIPEIRIIASATTQSPKDMTNKLPKLRSGQQLGQ